MAQTQVLLFVSLLTLLCLFVYVFNNNGYYPDEKNLRIPLMRNASRATTIITEKDIPLDETVFVTAADSSHFGETRDSIASVQTNLPLSHRILYYDLGLTEQQAEQIKHWCRVSYIEFNFTRYPPHVRNLLSYAWKPLIIQEVLQKYPAIVWFDSSGHFKCPDFMTQIAPTLRQSGVALIDRTGHNTFAVTHPGMYKYLPRNLAYIQNVQQLGASVYAVLNTTRIVERVLEPLVQCSLIKECISPTGSTLYCKFHKDRFKYANCHRYDQSALNILLLELFQGDISAYYANKTCVIVERASTAYFNLQMCK